jgi:hypothetical protein
MSSATVFLRYLKVPKAYFNLLIFIMLLIN